MRFGRTREEALLDWRKMQHLLNIGKEAFAWIPVRLHDGSWLWLETYVAAMRFREYGGGYKRVRFLPGSEALVRHREWAVYHAKRHFW